MKKIVFLLVFVFFISSFSFSLSFEGKTQQKRVISKTIGNHVTPKKKYKRKRKKILKKIGRNKSPKVKIFQQEKRDPDACSGV